MCIGLSKLKVIAEITTIVHLRSPPLLYQQYGSIVQGTTVKCATGCHCGRLGVSSMHIKTYTISVIALVFLRKCHLFTNTLFVCLRFTLYAYGRFKLVIIMC